MRLLIDADACPVVDIAMECAAARGIPVTLVSDTAHCVEREGAQTVVVEKGADSADFRLVNMARRGDVVVTQDYGLAAMCLAREAKALNQNGLIYTPDNIDSLLLSRHTARKVRNAGGRIKGPPKRTKENDDAFRRALERLLDG